MCVKREKDREKGLEMRIAAFVNFDGIGAVDESESVDTDKVMSVDIVGVMGVAEIVDGESGENVTP